METPSSVHRIKHADNEASFEQMWKDLEGEARLSMCSGALTILVGFYNQGSKTFYKGGRVWSVRFLQRIWDLVQEVEDPGMKLSILQNTATYVNIIKDNIQRFKEENLIANINRIQGLVDDALKNNGSLPMEAILRSPALSSTPTPATSQKPSNTLNSLPPPQPLQDTPTRPPSQQPSKRILTARQAELLALDLDSQLEIINPISPDSLFSSPTHPPLPEPQAPPEPEPDVEKTDPFEAPEAGMSHDQDAVASVVLQLLQVMRPQVFEAGGPSQETISSLVAQATPELLALAPHVHATANETVDVEMVPGVNAGVESREDQNHAAPISEPASPQGINVTQTSTPTPAHSPGQVTEGRQEIANLASWTGAPKSGTCASLAFSIMDSLFHDLEHHGRMNLRLCIRHPGPQALASPRSRSLMVTVNSHYSYRMLLKQDQVNADKFHQDVPLDAFKAGSNDVKMRGGDISGWSVAVEVVRFV